MKNLKKRLAVATKKEKAELVIKNGKIIDVFTLTIYKADIAIADGIIVGIGSYEGARTLDAKGAYISPSFIDGHVHIESAMVPPEEFAKIVVPHGVTSVIADPHEIANVGGLEAVQYMIKASKDLPLEVKMMVPSCVPATSFEHNGAQLTSDEIAQLFDEDGAYGLGEVMDYPSVFSGEEEMMRKLEASWQRRKLIDGHAAGLDIIGLNAYSVAGIRNDHEAVTEKEARERLQRGMYVLMREGTAAKDIEALLPVLTPYNARRCVFATDDKHLDDLVEEGSIDASVRKAIKLGVDPLQAIQMASLNAAECFKLDYVGAIAPGYKANFLLIRDLDTIEIESVYVKGKKVAEHGMLTGELRKYVSPPEHLLDSIHMKPLKEDSFDLKMNSNQAHIIGVTPGSIVTDHLIEEIDVKDGLFHPSVDRNQLKLVVAERHKELGLIGLGIVKGIRLKEGAIVATVAHDSHNIVACGVQDESIRAAIEHVAKIGGGIAVVCGKEVLAELPLPLGGLMSLASYEEVNTLLKDLEGALRQIGFEEKWNPFLTLSFLALPVIPSLKLTDTGLFDVKAFTHIEREA